MAEPIPITLHASCCPHCVEHTALMKKLIQVTEETDKTLERILKVLKR